MTGIYSDSTGPSRGSARRDWIRLVIEAVGVIILLAGLVRSGRVTERDLARLETNQQAQYEVIARQAAVIDGLVRRQASVEESRSAPSSSSRAPASSEDSGNDVTETLDYIGDVPQRIGREAERLVDKINPF